MLLEKAVFIIYPILSLLHGLEISESEEPNNVDFSEAVLDPETGLMCVYSEGGNHSATIQHFHSAFFGQQQNINNCKNNFANTSPVPTIKRSNCSCFLNMFWETF